MEWSTIPACPSLMCFVVDWAKNTNQLTNCSREPWLQKSVSPLLRRSAQLSPLTDWVVGEHEVRFIRDPLPVFSAGGPCGRFWHGQGCPLFDVVHPTFPLPITASPTLQGALKDGFGEAVVASDMPEPCKFPFLDSCRRRFGCQRSRT